MKNINKFKIWIEKISFFSTVHMFFLSKIAHGQIKESATTVGNLKEKTFQQIVADFILLASEYVLTVLVALTILVFLYGLMRYMFKGQGSDTARVEGRKLMLWGIIGIFVMTSMWGLVAILANFVGHTSVVIPQFK